MSKHFAEYKGLNLSEINREEFEKWTASHKYGEDLKEREGAPEFVFFDGPPSANGMPGIHHVMARTIKDCICRYKTQKGFHVSRKAGWDTHGLPVELSVEKSLGITKEDIGKKISVDDYNDACRKDVMKYIGEWTKLTHQMGYWIDMDDPYITYDNRYIESLWWLLKQMYNKGYLYKGYTIQPYSPAAGTGLSSHELNQPGCYRDVKDTTVTAIFDVDANSAEVKKLDPKGELAQWGKLAIIAWTTTPWTLPSNTALCVGPNIDYVAVQTFNPYNGDKLTVIMAEARLKAYLAGDEFNSTAEMEALDIEKIDGKKLPYHIVARYKGTDLIGINYKQLMPWVKPCEKVDDLAAEYIKKYAAEHPEKCFAFGKDSFVEISEKAFRVIGGDYVTTEDGTGIVHIAPTFGADDAKVAKAAEIPDLYMINQLGETRPMVDMTGKYYIVSELADSFVEKCVNVDAYSAHAGDFVKNAYAPKYNEGGKYNAEAAAKDDDLNIVMSLEMKKIGTAFKIEKHVHNYPHCWRTDKPVIYYPLDSWFIRSTACRERMMELNKTINWKPEYTGSGRFGKWHENLNDWNLSRSRYWGTPLPIWRNRDTREEICIGSLEELFNEIDKSVAAGFMKSNPYKDKGFTPGNMAKENYEKIDLHRPYVDDIILVSPSGKPMKRETDLIDVWFDSGAMPFAQYHYPFEHKDDLPFPADFIAEGVDQTRGWFYTLHAIATMCFDSVAFKNVISNGLVLDKNGNKMSKRLGNAINPFEVMDKYGADAVRWYMITNSQPWDNLKFDVDGVDEVKRKFFGTLYNTYSFFALYANIDGFTGKEAQIELSKRPEIDRWIISLLNSLVAEVTDAFEAYEPTRAGRAIQDFVMENLSNWYVRLNRKRFWGGKMDNDKLAAYQTLYECLVKVAELSAPIAPFFTSRLYRDLTGKNVHSSIMPESNAALIDKDLEQRMYYAQAISSMILALRRKVSIKVRQPLQKVMIPILDAQFKQQLESVKNLILTEVNVKEMQLLTDTEGVLVKKIKPNFKTLGPKYSKLMKQIAAAVAQMSQHDIAQFERDGAFCLNIAGETINLEPEDAEITSEDIPGWLVATEGKLTVALDIEISEELREEGIARELINRIQNLRKDSGFEVTDKIKIQIKKVEAINKAIEHHAAYIGQQTLATDVTLVDDLDANTALEVEIDEQTKTFVQISK
ncbi:MAG: isoleucine--tRNA ligase [Bacteroidales bacterium]|nr:isoleucine--tRNA ligase [Bacteroidales bacterium]